MKVTAKAKFGSVVVDVEAGTPKELFSALAMYSDILGDTKCGCCSSENLSFVVRRAGDNNEYTYYERRCRDCRAQLQMGQAKDMVNLFAKRGDHRDTNGWFQYQGGNQNQQHPQDDHYQPPPLDEF